MIEIKLLSVSDLHQSKVLYDQLEKAVLWHKPDVLAVVGDCLDLDDAGGRELSRADCARRLSALPCREIVFVRGNHESEGWLAFANAWHASGRMRMLYSLHAEAVVSGPLAVVGFPCRLGDDFHYLNGREPAPREFSKWLAPVFRTHGDATRTLWLMHEPPAGTRLSEEMGPMAGRIDWLAAIERYSPLLVVCGHDHRTPLRHNCCRQQVRQTWCVNTGQKLDGPLHYCLVEFDFPKPTPCLPSRIRVSAFPWDQSFEIAAE